MGAATERAPEVVLEDGLRKRKDGEKSGSAVVASDRVTPLNKVWKPSQRVQNITVWVLLVATAFFSVAVVVEELQASWYRSPALNILNSQFYGARVINSVLSPPRKDSDTKRLATNWSMTSGTRSLDGISSNVYLVNDDFPGPTLEVGSGETLKLDITNSLTGDDVELDFAWDIISKQSFWRPSLQKVVATARSRHHFEVRVPLNRYGTFMYRARSDRQAAGGIYGAVIIRPPVDSIEDIAESQSAELEVNEEQVVVISDFQHFTADRTAESKLPVIPPSVLINGLGSYNCSQLDPSLKINCQPSPTRSHAHFQFMAHRTYRLRIVNAALTSGMTVSVPGTSMTIIELSGQRLQPKRATSVGILRPGQTIDVLIRWESAGDDQFIVSLEDDAVDNVVNHAFQIRVMGMFNSKIKPAAPRHRDILRLKPLE